MEMKALVTALVTIDSIASSLVTTDPRIISLLCLCIYYLVLELFLALDLDLDILIMDEDFAFVCVFSLRTIYSYRLGFRYIMDDDFSSYLA